MHDSWPRGKEESLFVPPNLRPLSVRARQPATDCAKCAARPLLPPSSLLRRRRRRRFRSTSVRGGVVHCRLGGRRFLTRRPHARITPPSPAAHGRLRRAFGRLRGRRGPGGGLGQLRSGRRGGDGRVVLVLVRDHRDAAPGRARLRQVWRRRGRRGVVPRDSRREDVVGKLHDCARTRDAACRRLWRLWPHERRHYGAARRRREGGCIRRDRACR